MIHPDSSSIFLHEKGEAKRTTKTGNASNSDRLKDSGDCMLKLRYVLEFDF